MLRICIPYSWLERLRNFLCTELNGSEAISWAAYHAQSQEKALPDGITALSALLPLFHDEAKSIAMICHAMDVVRSAVEELKHVVRYCKLSSFTGSYFCPQQLSACRIRVASPKL